MSDENCRCQQDSIGLLSRSFSRPQSTRSTSTIQQGILHSVSHGVAYGVPNPPITSAGVPHIPISSSGSPMFIKTPSYTMNSSNKKIQIDNSKLLSSVYTKTLTDKTIPNERLVLRYTDGGIKKPVPANKIVDKNNFPRIMSRYVSKKTGRNSMPMYVDSYRPTSKLAVISQHFLWLLHKVSSDNKSWSVNIYLSWDPEAFASQFKESLK